MAYLSTLPPSLKAAIRKAVLEIATRDPAAFDKIYEGKQLPFQPVAHEDYEPVIEVDEIRRRAAQEEAPVVSGLQGGHKLAPLRLAQIWQALPPFAFPPNRSSTRWRITAPPWRQSAPARRLGLRCSEQPLVLAGIAGEVDFA